MLDKSKIANKRFNRAPFGYDIAEVDSFLDELIREVDRNDQEMAVLKLRVKMLVDELERKKNVPIGRDEAKTGAESTAKPPVSDEEKSERQNNDIDADCMIFEFNTDVFKKTKAADSGEKTRE